MIKEISLKNFRRFKNFKCSIDNNLIIFLGPNACGKTSILESIYLISKVKSHRTNDYLNLINNDSEFAIANIIDEANNYQIILSKNGKKVLINKVEYNKISEFIGHIKTVMFSPNDLNMIYGGKSIRRNFLDIELSMIDKKYLLEIKKYKKLLKERNEILKNYNDNNKKILDIITNELILCNEIIMNVRNNFINELNDYLNKIHFKLYKESISIKYLPSIKENIHEIYEKKLSYDILTKMTNYGIHRDDFSFMINDKEAINYVSQGQARSIVLSLKIALFYLLKSKYDDKVILLLDDVFSELDKFRINSLIDFLKTKNQTFITTTTLENIPSELLKDALVINLDKGDKKDGK